MRLWTLTLVGCLLSSHGLAEDQASDVQGQVCMAFGGNVKGYLPFKVDGMVVANLEQHRYVCVDLPPGEHQITADGGITWRVCTHWDYERSDCWVWETVRARMDVRAQIDVAASQTTAWILGSKAGKDFAKETRPQRLLGAGSGYLPTRSVTATDQFNLQSTEAVAAALPEASEALLKMTAQLQAVRASREPITVADVQGVQRCFAQGVGEEELLDTMRFTGPSGSLGDALFSAGLPCALTPARMQERKAAAVEAARVAALPKEPLQESLRRGVADVTPSASATRFAQILQEEANGVLDKDATAALVQVCMDHAVPTSALVDAVAAPATGGIFERFESANLDCGVDRRLLAGSVLSTEPASGQREGSSASPL